MLLLSLLLACSTEPVAPPALPITDAEVAAAAASSICAAATQAGMTCTADGGKAELGWKLLEVSATDTMMTSFEPTSIGGGEDAQRFPGEVQLATTVGLSVDGQALFAVEQNHVASDLDLGVARGKVIDELAQRWVVTHASAVMDAVTGDPAAGVIASLGMNVPAQPQGELYAFAGYPVLHGKGFDPGIANKLGPGLQTMLSSIGPFVEGADPATLHVVQVHARLGGGGAPGPCGIIPPVAITPGATTSIVPFGGEVKLDGTATGDICALSEPVAWPLPPAGAVLEWDQLIVLAPIEPAAAPAEDAEAKPEPAPAE